MELMNEDNSVVTDINSNVVSDNTAGDWYLE